MLSSLRHAKPACSHCCVQGADPEVRSSLSSPQPTLEAHSFDPRPGMSAWLLSHLEHFPPEGFLMLRGFLPSGLHPGVGRLMCKCRAVSRSPVLPLLPADYYGGSQSPAWAASTGHIKPQLRPLSPFPAPPPQSVPRNLLLFPKPVQLGGWERKARLSDLPQGLPETGVGKQTVRRGPHSGASGNSHLLYVIKWPTD